MAAKVIGSVPLLQKQWRVRGYIWQVGPYAVRLATMPPSPMLTYIGELPEGGSLVATSMPQSPAALLSDNGAIGPEIRAWKTQLYNDSSESIPFAVLDDTGRYYQLEAFSVPLEDDAASLAADGLPAAGPAICEFLIGVTPGTLHICPD